MIIGWARRDVQTVKHYTQYDEDSIGIKGGRVNQRLGYVRAPFFGAKL